MIPCDQKAQGVGTVPRYILTKEQVRHIHIVYSTEGGVAARKLAPGYGIKPSYVHKLCFMHGVKARRPINQQKKNAEKRRQNDPRWERAKAIGPIIA
jgi:hypothetical protein